MIILEPPAFVSPPPPMRTSRRIELMRVGRRDFKSASNRAVLARDIVRLRRLLMLDGSRQMTQFLIGYFEGRLDKFLRRIERGRSGKVLDMKIGATDVTINALDPLWREALQDTFGADANIELITEYQPVVQSVAARSNARTLDFIGEKLPNDAATSILRRSQALARQVTRINDTTKDRLGRMIIDGVDSGLTPGEIARKMRDDFPQLTRGRIPGIVRTEVGRAVDAGAKEAYMKSEVVTEVSVIGCQAAEKNSPQWGGRSTCNITGVPAKRVDELEFHPNHTGCIVPSGFADY